MPSPKRRRKVIAVGLFSIVLSSLVYYSFYQNVTSWPVTPRIQLSEPSVTTSTKPPKAVLLPSQTVLSSQLQQNMLVELPLAHANSSTKKQKLLLLPLLPHSTSTKQKVPLKDSKPTSSLTKQRKVHTCSRPVVSAVSCKKIFDGDETEIKKASRISTTVAKPEISARNYEKMAENCPRFRSERGYNQQCTCSSSIEKEFPLAFSILMYKDVFQVERLLRAIYRPQNTYCIHVDSKANSDVKAAMRGIVNCLKENVFLSSRSVDVKWGTFTVLEPELICMEDLLKRNKKWKYFMNLAGQEFPLRTNYELVKIFSAYNGANDIEGKRNVSDAITRFGQPGEAPHNIRPSKGSVHIAANRDFVEYAIHNQTALDFLEFIRNRKFSDETYFSTLNHNPQLGIRGTYEKWEDVETNLDTKPYLTRLVNWHGDLWQCRGTYVRGVCVFGAGDLPILARGIELFVNKFYWNYQYFALDCLEELYFRKTNKECSEVSDFDDEYYKSVGFVKHQI